MESGVKREVDGQDVTMQTGKASRRSGGKPAVGNPDELWSATGISTRAEGEGGSPR